MIVFETSYHAGHRLHRDAVIGRMTQDGDNVKDVKDDAGMTQDGDNVIVRIKMASENEWKGKP